MLSNSQESILWLTSTISGMVVLSILGSLSGILLMTIIGRGLKKLVRPNIEHVFYETILQRWFNGYFLRHRMVGAFIRRNNMGELIINSIIQLLGMLLVVALLSSSLTATLLHLKVADFVYSPYLLILMITNCMMAWSLLNHCLYFRKLLYRLK